MAVSCVILPARAVQTNGTFVTSAPTVSNWNTGWSTTGTTGWDYVGQVNGASAVYLGNNWVLTAGHVGVGNLLLDGNTYNWVAGSTQNISNSDGTADLCLFQISTAPLLNPLVLTLKTPATFSDTQPGDVAVMIGFGGGQGKTWGADTVNYVDQLIQPESTSWVSNDFITLYGSFSAGSSSFTNNAILVGGDSGGGDFIYDPQTLAWNLIGINEVVGTATIGTQTVSYSGMVQLNTYASQIQAITGVPVTVPEPSTWGLIGLGCAALAGISGRRPRR